MSSMACGFLQIREKEAAKNMRAMVMTADEEQHLTRLKRLPDLAKLLHGMFVAEKKSVIPLDNVVDRLTYSYTGALSASKFLIRTHFYTFSFYTSFFYIFAVV